MSLEHDRSTERAHVVAIAGMIRDELNRHARAADPVRRHLPANWQQLHAELDVAEESSEVGRGLSATHPRRGLKRAVTSCVLLLARVITRRQHAFNLLILSPLRALTGTVQRIEVEQARLDALVVEQEARIRRLEQALAPSRCWDDAGPAPAA
jgi:hypothetical protein